MPTLLLLLRRTKEDGVCEEKGRPGEARRGVALRCVGAVERWTGASCNVMYSRSEESIGSASVWRSRCLNKPHSVYD